MRFDQYVAVLDACVLAPMPVCDTLLRLASEPAFYTPKWSRTILDEVQRTLEVKLKRTAEQAERRIQTMVLEFPDAMVDGFSHLEGAMTNDPKDRHVLACAIRCGAHAIVSDNTRHFPADSLAQYGIECMSADKFIEDQYHLDPDTFIEVLTAQADAVNWTLPQLISKHVPSLSRLIVTGKNSL